MEGLFLDWEDDQAVDDPGMTYHLADTACALPEARWLLPIVGVLVMGAAIGLMALAALRRAL